MSAIRYRMREPELTIRQLVRTIIDEASVRGKTNLAIFDDGTLNAAVVASLAHTAIENSVLESLTVVSYAADDEQQAARMGELFTAFSPHTVETHPPAQPSGRLNKERNQNYTLSNTADENDALPLSAKDLTDMFIGSGEVDLHAYPILRCFLASEIEKLARTITDLNNANMKKEEADPKNTCLDNRLASQDNPGDMDFALCTVLAAKETECELLLGSYKEHEITEGFKRTRRARAIIKPDYNKVRSRLIDLCDEEPPTVDI